MISLSVRLLGALFAETNGGSLDYRSYDGNLVRTHFRRTDEWKNLAYRLRADWEGCIANEGGVSHSHYVVWFDEG